MYQKISSTKNSKIKFLLELQSKSRFRKKNKCFVVEGYKELEMAVSQGYKMQTLFFNQKLCSHDALNSLTLNANISTHSIFEVDSYVFGKIAYREGSGGVIGIFHQKDHSLTNLKLQKNPLIIVTEATEKPGNVGAILRTADAANVDAVILCNLKSDLYNPNVIRSSVGCIFSRQIAICDSEEAINYLKKNNINIYATALTASVPYYTIDYKKGSAIVAGTEATGLSDKWLNISTKNIIIPMEGINDSLNVSVSTAIVTFEALRQRKKL